MNSNPKYREAISPDVDTPNLSRDIMALVNKYPELPVALVQYEQLKADTVCMALSLMPNAYILQRYILGGYLAEYQFDLVYRVKPGNSMDKRLQADELLTAMAAWLMQQQPDFGENIRVLRIEPTTRAAVFAIFDNGDEDHKITIKINYEVNV